MSFSGVVRLAGVLSVVLGLAGACKSSSFSPNEGETGGSPGSGGEGGESAVGGSTATGGGPSGAGGGSGEGADGGSAPQGGTMQGGTAGASAGGAGEGGQDPTGGSGPTLVNQLLWLKADAITGLTNEAPVVSWPDSSGNDRDAAQSSAGLRPTYVTSVRNSLPVVHFTAANGTFLETPPFRLFETDSSPITLFVVFRTNDVSTQSFLLNQPQGACDSANFEFGYRTGDQIEANLGLHMGCNAANVTSSTLAASTWYVATLEVLSTGDSPENVRIRWNGADQTVVQNAGGWVSPGAYGSDSQHVVIGRRDDRIMQGVYNGEMDGDIGEIVVYSEVDSTLRANVEAYLRQKWDI